MSACEQVVPVTAINCVSIRALQATLPKRAKQSLDRRFGARYDKVYRLDVLFENRSDRDESSWNLREAET